MNNNGFKAIILYHHPIMKLYEGNNERCSSIDGIDGFDRYIMFPKKCIDCEYNKFGSGENGSKKCVTFRKLYLYRCGKIQELILSLQDVGNFGKYVMGLLESDVHSHEVITKFTLVEEKDENGILVVRYKFEALKLLDLDMLLRVKKIREELQQDLKGAER